MLLCLFGLPFLRLSTHLLLTFSLDCNMQNKLSLQRNKHATLMKTIKSRRCSLPFLFYLGMRMKWMYMADVRSWLRAPGCLLGVSVGLRLIWRRIAAFVLMPIYSAHKKSPCNFCMSRAFQQSEVHLQHWMFVWRENQNYDKQCFKFSCLLHNLKTPTNLADVKEIRSQNVLVCWSSSLLTMFHWLV